MKAIWYIRWSSDDQTAGSSLERQTDNVKAYCERAGLQIVETLIDEGLSEFKGEHLERGKLGTFLTEADVGKHRGFALVVEQLDRLSRLGITETGNLLKRILKAGLEIHITQTGRIIRDSEDITTALFNVLESWPAKEHSSKLKERVTRGWRKRIDAAKNGTIFTHHLPAWIADRDGTLVPIPEQERVVRRVFELASLGHGSASILQKLEQNVSRSWITKTLRNREVLGEFQTGDTLISDYFPAVVDVSVWNAVQEQLNKRQNQPGGNRTAFDSASNLFSRLLYDITDSPPRKMQYQESHGIGYLHSEYTTEKRKINRINYRAFEQAMLEHLEQVDWSRLVQVVETETVRNLRAQYEQALRDVDKVQNRIKATQVAMDADDIDAASLKILARKLAADEAAMMPLTEKKDAAETNLRAATARFAGLGDAATLLRLIKDNKRDVRVNLRAEIARKVKRIELLFFGQGTVSLTTTYINDVQDRAMFNLDEIKRQSFASQKPLMSLAQAVLNPS
jgi:DNA invertase Pin-like site-specific DNA recombinase